MVSSNRNRQLIYDEIRRMWVKATPEEKVRQRWLQTMVHRLQYPKELLVVEKNLRELPSLFSCNVPDRRVDILLFGKGVDPSYALSPLLLIECKHAHLTEAAMDQVIGYNHYVKAYFVAVVNQNLVRLGYFNAEKKKYEFCSVLPSYMELMQWIVSKRPLVNP